MGQERSIGLVFDAAKVCATGHQALGEQQGERNGKNYDDARECHAIPTADAACPQPEPGQCQQSLN